MDYKVELNSLLIVGVVKNVRSSLYLDLDRLASAFKDFKQINFFLVESNSSDGSLDLLEKTASLRSNFQFESLKDQKSINLERTELLSNARNRYLDYLISIPSVNFPDYVAVVDFNNLNNRLTRESVSSCWERSNWDVCTANQSGHYYDIWALRHRFWSPNDCWLNFQFLIDRGVRRDRAYSTAINSRMIKISPTEDWIEVDSAFGGLAIYKSYTLLNAKYAGRSESGDAICEHVPLHDNMRSQGYRIFVNPKLINFKYTDHSMNVFIWKRVLRFLKHSIISRFR